MSLLDKPVNNRTVIWCHHKYTQLLIQQAYVRLVYQEELELLVIVNLICSIWKIGRQESTYFSATCSCRGQKKYMPMFIWLVFLARFHSFLGALCLPPSCFDTVTVRFRTVKYCVWTYQCLFYDDTWLCINQHDQHRGANTKAPAANTLHVEQHAEREL